MPWTKLDDGFYLNPKVAGLTDGAYRLYIQALNYSCDQLTDGEIRTPILNMLISGSPATVKKRAAELVEAGLWVKSPRGWVINDFAEYQPTAAEIRRKSEKKARAGELGNHKRWHQDSIDSSCRFCDSKVIAPAIPVRERVFDGASPPEPEPEPEEVLVNGNRGVWGGCPPDIPMNEWIAAARLADQRIAEGYEPNNYGAFIRHIWVNDRDKINQAIARGVPAGLQELAEGIGRLPEGFSGA